MSIVKSTIDQLEANSVKYQGLSMWKRSEPTTSRIKTTAKGILHASFDGLAIYDPASKLHTTGYSEIVFSSRFWLICL